MIHQRTILIFIIVVILIAEIALHATEALLLQLLKSFHLCLGDLFLGLGAIRGANLRIEQQLFGLAIVLVRLLKQNTEQVVILVLKFNVKRVLISKEIVHVAKIF